MALATASPLDASTTWGFFCLYQALVCLALLHHWHSFHDFWHIYQDCRICYGLRVGPFFDKVLSFVLHFLFKSLLFFCHHVKYSFTESTHSKGFCFLFLWGFLCETPSSSFAFSLGSLSLLESKIKLKDMGGTCSLALALPLALCKALFMLFRFESMGGVPCLDPHHPFHPLGEWLPKWWDQFLNLDPRTLQPNPQGELGSRTLVHLLGLATHPHQQSAPSWWFQCDAYLVQVELMQKGVSPSCLWCFMFLLCNGLYPLASHKTKTKTNLGKSYPYLSIRLHPREWVGVGKT